MDFREVEKGIFEFDNGVAVEVGDTHVWVYHEWPALSAHSRRWSCSNVTEYESIEFMFDANGLCDMAGVRDDGREVSGADIELANEEMIALTFPYLKEVLGREHVCWLVAVGQFLEEKGLQGEIWGSGVPID